MLIGFVGYKGSGKTLIMVFFGYLLYKSGRKIMANLKLSYPYDDIDPKDIAELSPNLIHSAILLDEIHMLADSRRSPSGQNRCIGYFILQSRHRDCDVLYTTQQDKQVDKRIRENTEIKVICENLYEDSDEDGKDDMFRIVIIDRRKYPPIVTERKIYGKPIFDMYDTNYIINPFEMKKPERKKKKKKP